MLMKWMILKAVLIHLGMMTIIDTLMDLNNFLDAKTTGDTDGDPAGAVSVNTGADHNEWGRIGVRPTRHSLSGIPSNGQMRLGHKPVCGLCESNYYLPLRFAPLELEFTIVSDSNEPIVVPQGDATTNPDTETDKQGYYFQGGQHFRLMGNQ